MTRDPERLLSATSEADPFERELLASLRDEQAPAAVRRGAWQGIAAGLVAAAPATAAAAGAVLGSGSAAAVGGGSSAAGGGSLATGATAASSGAGAATGSATAAIGGSATLGGKLAAGLGAKAAALLLSKWVVVGALGAGAVGGTIWAVDGVRHRAPSQTAGARLNAPTPSGVEAQSAKRREASAEASAALRGSEESAANPNADASEQAAPLDPGDVLQPSAAERGADKSRRGNALAAESALLQTARADLRAGNLDAAKLTLEHLRKRFPRGVLNQEREVLRIELLSAQGNDAGARRLAAHFLKAHPESPHAAQLRPLTAAE